MIARALLTAALALAIAPGAQAAARPKSPLSAYARVRPACKPPTAGSASCFALVRTPAKASEAARPGVKRYELRDGAASAGPAGGLTPAELAAAYGYEPAAAPPSEQTIAIVDAYNDPDIESDLKAFDDQYGLPDCDEANGCFKKVGQTGSKANLPANDTEGWSVEISLDVEMARSACLHCRILLVEAENSEFASLGAAVDEAVRLGATVVSNSYGGAEGEFAQEEDYVHPGVVIAAATGDDGFDGWISEEEPERPNVPASLPSVVAVGGTTLTLDAAGHRKSETVWDGDGLENEAEYSAGATGGGCSLLFTAQPWQQDVVGFAATGCGTKRSTADVAADADPLTGFDIYDSFNCGEACELYKAKGTDWLTIGGTSLATPLISALYGLAGGSNGISYPALTLYGHLGQASALDDITQGGNGYCDEEGLACGIDGLIEREFGVRVDWDCEGTTACNAATGFDGPSGVGAPNSISLFKPLHPTAAITPPQKLTAGVSAAFSATASSDPYPGGTPLSYQWVWGDGETSSGAAPSHTFAKSGSYTVTLTVTDAYGIESIIATAEVSVAERTAKELEEEAAAKKKAEEEAAAKKKAEEEAAAEKKAEEETAAKKKTEEETVARGKAEAEREQATATKTAEEEAVLKARAAAEAAAAAAKAQTGVSAFKSVADPDATLARTVIKVGPSGRLTLLVECPAAETSCSGTVLLRTIPATAARGGRRPMAIAEGSFTVAGGRQEALQLRISRSARALLRRKGTLGVHVTLASRDPAGAHHTTVVLVTLRGARRS